MRSLSRPTLSALALALLTACPPIDPVPMPPLVETVDLRSGDWMLHVVDATLAGPCAGVDPREVVGAEMEAVLRLRGGGRALVVLDGIQLRGEHVGPHLDVSGYLPVFDGEPEPEEERPDDDRPDDDRPDGDRPDEDRPDDGDLAVSTDVDSDDSVDSDDGAYGDDDGAPGEPEPAYGAEVALFAVALSPRSMEGTLTVSYDLPDFRCVIEADFEGRFGGATGEEEPVVVGTGGGCGDDEDCG